MELVTQEHEFTPYNSLSVACSSVCRDANIVKKKMLQDIMKLRDFTVLHRNKNTYFHSSSSATSFIFFCVRNDVGKTQVKTSNLSTLHDKQ